MSDGLASRWAVRWEAVGRPGADDEAVVALSGGPDSLTLLHLLRFASPAGPLRLSAAHLDHAMRPDSAGESRWVAGVCRAWGVPLATRRLSRAPGGEAEARHRRYRFLEEVRKERGARWILTAHHADDQAETVLHRVLRGTGVGGLRGIPERREPGVLRPLLPFRRAELRAYAERARLRALQDPSNRDIARTRNRIRHRILPEAARAVPDPTGALIRLARLARQNEAGWESLLPDLLEEVLVEASEGRIVLARPAFLGYHPHVRSRLLRALLGRLGIRLDETGTRVALEFTTSGRSGGGVDLPGGARLLREFDHLLLVGDAGRALPDRTVEIPAAGAGSGRVRSGGRDWRVRWGPEPAPESGNSESFVAPELEFPLRIRAPEAGDRIRLEFGEKKVVRLLAEARIPRSERASLPILVDAKGSVLWIPGVRKAHPTGTKETEPTLFIGIAHADPD